MSPEMIATIERYLTANVQGTTAIEHRLDFDLGAETFKVAIGRRTLLLKVSEVFAEDHSADEVATRLEQWRIADLLANHGDLCVVVTSDGATLQPRD